MESSKCIGGGQGRCIERGQHFRWMGFFRFPLKASKTSCCCSNSLFSLSSFSKSKPTRRGEATTVQ
ncbi:hypothetical protein NC651_037932 [Populus alba x Populus x berolinensis]|nr:hypothetical protein NC651_037932 [Populus alba x Populus x berolinensis]